MISSFQPRAVPFRIVINGRPLIQRPIAVYKSSTEGIFAQVGKSNRQSRLSLDEDPGSISNRLSVAEPEGEIAVPVPNGSDPLTHDSIKVSSPIAVDDDNGEDQKLEFVTLQDIFEEIFPGKSTR